MRHPRMTAQWIIVVVAGGVTACDATEPRGPGSIAISATAQSQEPMGFQYAITVDNGTPRTAFVGAPISFAVHGLAHGAHVVSATGVPSACTGAGDHHVTLRGDDTAHVTFNIQCARTTGDINVTVATTGTDRDLNGYLVLVNQMPRAMVVSNGTTNVRFIQPGAYTISLGEVAANCTASASQSVTVAAGAVAAASFSVSCVPIAVVRVVAGTTGADRDPDGFTFAVDQATPIRVPPSGTMDVRVGIGTHTYSVADIAPNCAMSAPASASITVAAGDTVMVNAQVACTPVDMGTVTVAATDPVADTMNNVVGSPAPALDLVALTGRYSAGWMILVLRFTKPVVAASSGATNALHGVVDLDVDENVATGMAPLANAYGGNAPQGSDYLLNFFAGDTASVAFTKTSSGGSAATGRVRTLYAGDSVIVQIPLNKLGNDDGNMTISAIVGTKDRPTDIVPNTGVITARVPAAAIVAGALSAVVTRDTLNSVAGRVAYRRATTGWPRPAPVR